MENKYLKIFILLAFMNYLEANSQLTVIQNDATTIFVENNGIFYVEGNMITENTGIWDNSGTIHLSGDWVNNSTSNGFSPTSTGIVRMFGANQSISGTSSTYFYDLILDGGSSIKYLLTSAQVSNHLNLVDAELQTNDVIMHVTNPLTNSISWNTGYVNSNNLGGYLARSTNVSNTYIFPVGDRGLTNRYRAVEITPNTPDSNVFAIRVIRRDPSTDNTGVSATGAIGGFDVNTKNSTVKKINTDFYHNIAHLFGPSTADVGVNYFASDGMYQTMTQWQDATNQWEPTTFANSTITGSPTIGSPDRFSFIALFGDFAHDVFALTGVDGVTIPGFISPNSDGDNDVLVIENIDLYPNNNLQVFNRYGNIVYEQDGYNNDWDGSVKNNKNPVFNYTGNILPAGTYFYILNLGVEGIDPYLGYIQIQK